MNSALSSIDAPIAISGGGIAGLTTALALANVGLRSVVLEKAETFEKLGAGIQLSPNAVKVLNQVGLGEVIPEKSVEPSEIWIFSGISGRKITRLPLAPAMREKFGAPYFLVHRADLHDMLVSACRGNPLVDLRMASEVQNAADTVGGLALLVERQGMEPEQVTSPLLIAADGVWSRLRTQVFDLPPAEFSGKIAWRALLPASHVHDSSMLSHTSVWFGPHAHIVAYPVARGALLNLIVIVEGHERETDGLQTVSGEQICNRLGHWHSNAGGLVCASDNWTGWPLYEHTVVTTLARNRAVLVGDAAHAMMPFAAQGGAMAIEDAAVLARCLASAQTIPDGLKSYETARCDRINKVMALARANGKIYHHYGPMAFARNAVMRATPPGLLMKRQDWIYGWEA